MRTLPYFADPETREDILDHISGFAFDRALVRSDEPIRFSASGWRDERDYGRRPERKRSVRR